MVDIVHTHQILDHLFVDVLHWVLLDEVFKGLDGFINFVQKDLACRQIVCSYDVRWPESLHASKELNGVFVFFLKYL